MGAYRGARGAELAGAARLADRAARGALREALGDLPGKTGSTLLLRRVPGLAAERVLLVALGERGEFAEVAYRDAVRGAANALKDLGATDAAVFLAEPKVGARPPAWNVRQLVLGMREAFYRFDQLKTQ
jgi:leucyl aminopeptidase